MPDGGPGNRSDTRGVRGEARQRVAEAFRDVGEDQGPMVRRAAEQDALTAAMAPRVFAPDGDLCVAYMAGFAIAHYTLLGPSGGAGLPASALAARLEVLRRYYEYLDGAIAPLVDRAPGNRVLVSLSDPGPAASRGPGARPPAAGPLDRDVLERLRSLGYVR